jgi:hypothetical protein
VNFTLHVRAILHKMERDDMKTKTTMHDDFTEIARLVRAFAKRRDVRDFQKLGDNQHDCVAHLVQAVDFVESEGDSFKLYCSDSK